VKLAAKLKQAAVKTKAPPKSAPKVRKKKKKNS